MRRAPRFGAAGPSGTGGSCEPTHAACLPIGSGLVSLNSGVRHSVDGWGCPFFSSLVPQRKVKDWNTDRADSADLADAFPLPLSLSAFLGEQQLHNCLAAARGWRGR